MHTHYSLHVGRLCGWILKPPSSVCCISRHRTGTFIHLFYRFMIALVRVWWNVHFFDALHFKISHTTVHCCFVITRNQQPKIKFLAFVCVSAFKLHYGARIRAIKVTLVRKFAFVCLYMNVFLSPILDCVPSRSWGSQTVHRWLEHR